MNPSTSSAAFIEGYNHAKGGGDANGNPYTYNTIEWNDWADGFLKAIREEMH